MNVNQVAGIVFVVVGLMAIMFNRKIGRLTSAWTIKYYNRLLPIIANEQFGRGYLVIIGIVFCTFGFLFILKILGGE